MPNAVVDANIVVSAFIDGRDLTTSSIALRRLLRRYTLLASTEIRAEYAAVLARPKFHRYGADPESIAGFLERLLVRSLAVTPAIRVADCRDPKDAIYLEAALAGQAELVLTGDRDLLALHPWRGIAILRPAAFLALG